ncbi:unnamed protein product [Rotaria sp. Silwood2]|nr:unnamed protein product [Rotaria sp. Silwood2]CAF2467767.1 unnamed protein product [Rotaria sp. Silwood2]CAF2703713.1 unnamed protein product [Rotaria sp. Silwood2]CAF2856277.1 unnamed protein product [Rotaria sp. Silwood2]CAF4211889.1 unnamed protein product [Rotaria sp. Silwood2]
MDGIQYNQYGINTSDQNQGHQYTLSAEGPVDAVSLDFIGHQQNLTPSQSTASIPKVAFNAPITQSLGGVQATSSFHSISSLDSSAEMSKYFPEATTPNLVPLR